jgi:hypothetical protein
VKNSKNQFYLTGGTVLSRIFYRHRYSDDLDFFLNNADDFQHQSKELIISLETNGYYIHKDTCLNSSDFISFFIRTEKSSPINLKVDLVNDVAVRFGDVENNDLFIRTDNRLNILSNKLCALMRLEIKDFSDIWIIAKNEPFNWGNIISEAREKELGIEPIVIADLMRSIPQEKFNSIKWINIPEWKNFFSDYKVIIQEMLNGDDNSLNCKI